MRCGELCKSCHGKCREDFTEPVEVQCPFCREVGCDYCKDQGTIPIASCPRQEIGLEMATAIGITVQCSNGILPVTGGLLQQTNWFLELKNTLDADENHIQSQRLKQDS